MKKYLMAIMLIMIGLLTACNINNGDDEEKYFETIVLDSAFSIVPYVQVIDKDKTIDVVLLREELSAITNELDNVFNPNKETSVISEINRNSGIAPVKVSGEVIYVIKEAIKVSEETIVDEVALYDISVLPVWEKWLFTLKYYHPLGDNRETIPKEETITKNLHLIDYKKIIIDEENSTVFLSEVGMKIDLGSIVKGYSCDKIKDYLLTKGYTNALIDVGGNVMTLGYNYELEPKFKWINWYVKVATPYVNQYTPNYQKNHYIATLQYNDITAVTSGIYERYIKTEDGTEYHHIIDPRNGYPLDSGLMSVTIFTSVSMSADAYSTAVFSLGLDKGMKLINNHDELEAIFITKNKEIYISSGLENKFVFNTNIKALGYSYKGVYNEIGH